MDGSRARRSIVATFLGLVLLAATMTPVAAAARPADALAITGFAPKSGPVGTAVTIRGHGFGAGDIVQFNGTSATPVTTNNAGTRLHASVPLGATSGPITVTDPATGQTVGLPGSVFTVTRGLVASPDHVWAGGALTIFGSGLSPDHRDEVFLGKLRLGTVLIDRNGDFELGTEVPFDEHTGRVSISVLDPNIGSLLRTIFVLGAWPTYRHDVAHTGYDDFETSLSVSSVASMKQLWTKSTDPSGYFGLLPSVTDGLVYEGVNQYATGDCSNLFAFVTTGKSIPWFNGLPCGYKLGPAPAEANGVMYYVAAANLFSIEIAARDAASGSVVFDTSIASDANPVRSAPAVANGKFFEGSGDGKLYALDATSGAPLWSFDTGGPVGSSPAFSGGIVYVGSDSGSLFAIKAATGKKVWSAPFAAAVASSPAVSGGVVYVGSDDGSVAAFDAATGAPAWKRTFNGRAFRASPAVANGVVFISGDKGANSTLYALDAGTGATKWSFTSGAGMTDAAVANGVVYVAVGSGNTVYAIDAMTGNPVWNTNVATHPLAPIIANGQVYIEGGSSIWAFGL